MRKFKVAHVINSLGLGGVPEVAYRLMKGLPSENYHLYLYVLKRYADHPEVREGQAERFRQAGIDLSFPEQDEKKFHVVADLCRWIHRDRIDLLHTHSYKPNIYGRLAGLLCKENGLNMVAHYHNHYDNKWEKDGSLIYDQLLERASARLVACSESVRRHLSERIGVSSERIEIIPNGVDLDRFASPHDPEGVRAELGIPRDRKVVGIVGRISEQKGQEDFIQAARLIHQKVPGTVFLIVGAADDNVLMARLQRLAGELGLEKEVLFMGYIPDMPKVYSALDLLVVPSRWEGFGLVLVEAMAAGKPIVATEVGAIPEVVAPDETALLVPPGSPDSIADRAVFLLKNRDRAEEMGKRGVLRSKRFSWEKGGAQLDRLYQAILKGREAIIR